jgi:23S rRNA-/tRNA-specific pseudouridylate synthase
MIQNQDNVDIPIIYENDRLLAVNKPTGLSHHDNTASGELGVLSLIRKRQACNTFAYPRRLYGVHRLDRVTSGILLLAKDTITARLLADKFRNKEISKWYIGISGRKSTKKKQGWVRGQLVKGRRGSYKLVNDNGGIIGNRLMMNKRDDNIRQQMDDNNDEFDDEVVDVFDENNDDSSCRQEEGTTKEQGAIKNGNGGGNIGYAETRFYTAGLGNLFLHPSLLVNNDQTTNDEEERQSSTTIPRTLILFQPHTGKTHQLRVAAKSIAMPLLGDTRYGGGRLLVNVDDDDDDDSDVSNWDRTYLHASAIHFNLENNHDECSSDVTIWSPPPFHHLATTGLEDVYFRLMDKHCDCSQILDAIRNNNNKE